MNKFLLSIVCFFFVLCCQQSNAQSKKEKRKHKTEQQTTPQIQPPQSNAIPHTPNPVQPHVFTSGRPDTAALTTKASITQNPNDPANTEPSVYTDDELKVRLSYFYAAGNWKALKNKAEQEKKVFMVDFYTDWCRVCKQMDREIFAQDQTIQLFNRYFLAYKLNAEKSEKSIADGYGVSAYPTFIFFDYKGNELGRITGYLAKDSFLQHLNQYKPKTPNTRYTKFR